MKLSLTIAIIFLVICNFDLGVSETPLIPIHDKKLAHLEKLVSNLNLRLETLEQKNEDLEKSNAKMATRIQRLEDENKDINDELQYLKELSKLKVVRTCQEMYEFGIRTSNYYFIDPDGPLIGKEPIQVYCEFNDENVATKISHNSEDNIKVGHCDDPGCYSREITYDAPMEQIQSLIELSKSCSQEIRYDCFLAPLQDGGVNFASWVDRNGEDQIYWTGAHFGEHVCSCHSSEEGCFMEDTLHNTCNCDSKEPTDLSDVGIIMNSTALPVKELRFGGLTFKAQTASHTLGKLECYGKKSLDSRPGSCSDLKRMGIFTCGFYNVKKSNKNSKLVYCDMTTDNYDDVVEEFIESSETHSETIEQSIANFESEANDHFIALEKAISDINTELPNLPGKWSGGSYCILANGDCPAGFTRYEGHIHTLKIYECSSTASDVKEVYFGDSSLKRHANCHYGAYSEINIRACCK